MLFNFYIDFDGELDTLLYMLGGGDKISAADRAYQYGIPSDIAAKVKHGKKCPALASYLKKQYSDFDGELKQSLKFHKKFWAKHGDFYRKKFQKILEHKMPDYSVRLNMQAGGISNWHGTDISINAFDYLRHFKTGMMMQALVWESMLSQAFIDIRKKYAPADIDDHKVWGISELTAVAIYQTDFCKSDWDIGYRELAPHQNAIKKLYENRKNFSDYLDKAVAYFKKKAGEKCIR
jgi:hypothetical protein